MFFNKIKSMMAAYKEAVSENAQLKAELAQKEAEKAQLKTQYAALEKQMEKVQQNAASDAAIAENENEALRDEAFELRQENCQLKEHLQRANKATKTAGWSRAVACYLDLAKCSVEELRSRHSNYEVLEASGAGELSKQWMVVTAYCAHCGSNVGKVFDDERKALTYALLNTAAGFSPNMSGLCEDCQHHQ